MRRPSLLRLLIAFSAAATAACGSDSPTVPTQPNNPTAVTEAFSGTLTVNGAITFAPISVTSAGSANATLTSLQPRLTMRLAAGGTGAFAAGETAYIGESLESATGTVTVFAFNPPTRGLLLNDQVGTLPLGETIVGASSGARWVNEAVTNTAVGLALGTWSGSTCTIVLANDISPAGGVVSGVVQGAGTLCARVYDVGRLEVPSIFTIEVTHF